MEESVSGIDREERGRRQNESRERPGAPVPVALASPASCHQEIGNAANEERPGGERSNDDGSRDPSGHRQLCEGQLRVIF